jgi:DNA invertase Pin-like site-specific DNA recombinase
MRRAIGIVRVSQVAGRAGDSFASPGEQRDRIEAACARDGLELVELIDEMDVSGGTPLEQRHGLRRAVEAVEAGEVQVVVAAYFDRLVRSLRVQDELVSRVERAGGQVLAVDVGAVSEASAGQWLSGTMLGAVSEYQRRTAAERSAEAQARAVARGVLPYPNVPPGYVRGSDGALVVDRPVADIVLAGFEMRAAGATVAEVREHLAAHGVVRSYHGVGSLLASRVVLGEVHFGALVNLHAHEAIVPRDLWLQVQRVRTTRGARAKSDRLLARLGVLRCGTCDARMVVGTSHHSRYFLYRCPPNGDCPRRVTIAAEMVEEVVAGAVRALLSGVEGKASVDRDAEEAAGELERAQRALDAAVAGFAAAGVESERTAVTRLTELRGARDMAAERVEHLRSLSSAVTLTAVSDWEVLSLAERRALVRATIARVVVHPGRGVGRITVESFG